MVKFRTKKLAYIIAISPLLLASIGVNAQTGPNSVPLSPSAQNSEPQKLEPSPPPPVPNQDIPVPMVGQAANIPLNNQRPVTITDPNALEKAMGIEVPDILRPNAPIGAPQSQVPQSPIITAPSRPATPQEIAREIAPNFNVATQYTRLTQCYGTADFMAAFMRVRANRPGAAPQMRAVADQISGMKIQMQPFVLAASTVRTEARFRADYDRVAKNISGQISRSRNPDAIIQNQLRTLDACSRDLNRWRGGR